MQKDFCSLWGSNFCVLVDKKHCISERGSVRAHMDWIVPFPSGWYQRKVCIRDVNCSLHSWASQTMALYHQDKDQFQETMVSATKMLRPWSRPYGPSTGFKRVFDAQPGITSNEALITWKVQLWEQFSEIKGLLLTQCLRCQLLNRTPPLSSLVGSPEGVKTCCPIYSSSFANHTQTVHEQGHAVCRASGVNSCPRHHQTISKQTNRNGDFVRHFSLLKLLACSLKSTALLALNPQTVS